MKLNNLKDLYIEQLRDLYSAESQIIDALPKMIERAGHDELKQAFQEHLEVTRRQRDRLDQILNDLGERPGGHTCKAMQGLIAEAQELMKERADQAVLDAGLITSAQRVEHYEIAGYGTVATYAETLGRQKDHDLLGQTLQEERSTDERLTRIAVQVVNPEATEA